jgi:hypothetical protein
VKHFEARVAALDGKAMIVGSAPLAIARHALDQRGSPLCHEGRSFTTAS